MTATASKSKANQVDLVSIFRFIPQIISLICVFIIIAGVTGAKLAELKTESIYRGLGMADATAAERTRQLECLALNIYREAGYEPFEGKVGVAQVTLNRVTSPDFPNDVCQVVYQKNVVYQRVICQFSWYCDRVHRNRPVNPSAYQESMDVAKKVLLEGFRLPGLTDALYYHADYVSPGWRNKEKIVKIGAHIFYRPKDKRT
jgi:spore germination cell wall hydrolase CwlJ-like protein